MSSRVGSWLQQLIVHRSGLFVLRSNYDPGNVTGAGKKGAGSRKRGPPRLGFQSLTWRGQDRECLRAYPYMITETLPTLYSPTVRSSAARNRMTCCMAALQ